MNKHQFKLPNQNFIYRIIRYLTSNTLVLKIRRIFMRYLPFLQLKSKVTNIVYLSWIIDYQQIKHLCPHNVSFWQKDGKTIFTILSYQHHHFGFKFLGYFRRFFPSPKQSNWRFYLNQNTHPRTVVFQQVIMDHILYVVGGRLASDVLPAQYTCQFRHQHYFEDSNEYIHTQLSLDDNYHLESIVNITENKTLPETWQSLFNSWDDAVDFLVDQNFAWAEWSDQPNQFSQGEIDMPVDRSQIQAVNIHKIIPPTLLKTWGISEDQRPFAFLISKLDFNVINEFPITK